MKISSEKYRSGEKALTREEYDKLLSVVDNLEDELLFRLAVSTGIRREDICNITTNNIDLIEKTILFHESKKDKREKIPKEKRYVNGKRIKSKVLEEEWRTIHIPDNIVVLLNKLYNSWTPQERKSRVKLFEFTGRTAYNKLNDWCKVAKINTRPFHALRATCAKFAKNAGWSDEEISRLTGDNIRTIQLHYTTPSVGEMAETTRDKPFA